MFPKEIPDSEAFLDLVEREQLTLPLNRILHQPGAAESLGEDVLVPLSERATKKLLWQLHLCRQLGELVALLESDGIATWTFKGVTLSMLAHGTPVERESVDIDLIVSEDDYFRALRRLLDEGFEFEMDDMPKCYPRYANALGLVHRGLGVSVDLHRRLFDNAYPFTSNVFSLPSQLVEIQGRSFRTLASEELFVYLCLHGAKHCWRKLRWLHDLANLWERVDQAEVLRAAQRQRLTTTVGVALRLLHKLWCLPLPRELVETQRIVVLAEEALGFLENGVPSWRSYYTFQFRMLDSLVDRLRYLVWVGFTPQMSDLREVELPEQWYLLYYPVRTFRVLKSLWHGRLGFFKRGECRE